MPKKPTKKTKTGDTNKYLVSFTFGDKSIVGSGASMLEAIRSVPRPVKIFNKCVLRITDGNRKLERVFMPIKSKRFFYPNSQPFLAKYMESLLR